MGSDSKPRLVTTSRLRLEPIGPEHAEDLWRLHQDESIAEWWGQWSKADAKRRAVEMGEDWSVDKVSKWMAYDKDTSELIGRGGLSRKLVDGERRLEVGWAILGRYWGRGYATEIGEAGLAFAFDELGADEVVAFTEPHNRRSRAVMERLQMRYLREITHEGEPFVLYAIDEPGFREALGRIHDILSEVSAQDRAHGIH